MKRQTKADRILNQARERLEIARQNVETAESQLGIAQAAFNAHQMAYNALEKELAPTPRKAAKKAAGSPVAQKEQVKTGDVPPGLCSHTFGSGSVCLATASNAIHDPEFEYAGHHPFVPSKPVARASRKSRQKSEAALSDQSSGTVTDSAGVAANAASGD